MAAGVGVETMTIDEEAAAGEAAVEMVPTIEGRVGITVAAEEAEVAGGMTTTGEEGIIVEEMTITVVMI